MVSDEITMTETVSGLVTDIQHFSIHDGPGIRTTVFLKGCPLKCQWCHNPECISFKPEVLYHDEFCIRCGACVDACPHGCHTLENGHKAFNRDCCQLALLCLERCWAEALELKGRAASAQEVIGEVNEDRIFYEKTGGGVTISGGEPLAQPDFTRALLAQAKREGLHTVVDTSGLGGWSVLESIIDDTDLFLYDIKCHDPELHKQLTGVSNRLIKANLENLLRCGADVILRMPLVAGLNDQEDEMVSLAKWLRALQPGLVLHLLPYHKYGEQKYESLGLKYSLLQPAPPQPDKLLKLTNIAEAHDLKTTIKGMEKSQALR